MADLANISKSYGKQFNIAAANADGDVVLSSYGLPSNVIIISSPIDEDNNDIGSYSLIATDYDGSPARLTYTIAEGNGLIAVNDILSLNIDNDTIVASYNGMSVSKESIIDESTLNITNNVVSVNTGSLEHAKNNKAGVVILDGSTIGISNGKIYVDTESLTIASDYNSGVVTSDGKQTTIVDGKISILTENLTKAGDTFGISKNDGYTIKAYDGMYSVVTANLSKSTDSTLGVSTPDNSTIVANNGIYSVNTEKLQRASTTHTGVINTNSKSIISNNGVISVKDYDNIITSVNDVPNRLINVDTFINKVNETLENYVATSSEPTINDFYCNAVTSAVLTKSQSGVTPDKIASEKVTAEFTINTNCPFRISVTYDDNIFPGIYLYQIDYDRVDIYQGNLGLEHIFQSTNNKDKIIQFSFICKNYAISDYHEYSRHTRIHISVNYTQDNSVSDNIDYDIVRFNTMYNISNAGEIMDNYIRLEKEKPAILNYMFTYYTNPVIDISTNPVTLTASTTPSGEYTLYEIETGNWDSGVRLTYDNLYYSVYSQIAGTKNGTYLNDSITITYTSSNSYFDIVLKYVDTYHGEINITNNTKEYIII